MKSYQKALFVFHRDLRLEDNTGLLEALRQSEQVIPIFIFTKKQFEKNDYRGDFLIQFMIESLGHLNGQLKSKKSQLYCFYGKTDEVIDKLTQQEGIQAVFSNRDHTPFAIQRDEEVLKVCQKNKVALKIYHDALLQAPGKVKKDDGKPYTVFTPFFRKASALPVTKVQSNKFSHYFKGVIKGSDQTLLDNLLPKVAGNPDVMGGRQEGLRLLKKIKDLKNYKEIRDIPSEENGTTHLSAHHKFGTISIRETLEVVLNAHGPDHTLITELYWRDFFSHIAFHFPHVFKGAFREKYNQIKWSQSKVNFEKWCAGKTGFPIVDAGMRQLNQTGYMHNRVRMITASFLVKDLHINWQWGEKYFAQKLLDYDPAVNNGNWQWAASTGCDAQPYFRIFNPWRQQERFDPEAKYIKKWVPELNGVNPKDIHKLAQKPELCPSEYIEPIVDHSVVSKEAKDLFKNID